MTKRLLDADEERAIIGILSALPRDVIAHILKTTNLPISDVFIFCQTSKAMLQLCIEKRVWKDIYAARFPDLTLRQHANTVFSLMTFEKGRVRVQMQFTSNRVRILSVTIGWPLLYVIIEKRKEVVKIVSSICGQQDREGDVATWTSDFSGFKIIFIKMIIYKLFADGYELTRTHGVQMLGNSVPIGCTVCNASAANKCSHCQEVLCGEACFNKHDC